MMPVSPWFFTNLPGFNKNWMWRGDDLWYDRWVEVLVVQPEIVEILTWNDFGESHYISPLDDQQYGPFSPGIGNATYNYAENMPHDGWRQFLPYSIDLYKYGTASIDKEGLVVWFRPSNKDACSTGGTTGNTASQLQYEFSPKEVAQSKIFYSALLGSSGATITVTVGGVVYPGAWKNSPDGGVGIYHGSVDYSGYGDVVVSMIHSGTTTSVSGSISSICQANVTNWNAWVGYKWGQSISTTKPALSIYDQKCTEGRGAGVYNLICQYTCQYGYCPLGACVCTRLGAQKRLPVSSGIKGYPLPGSSPSWEGLCDFACNLAYCPPDHCSANYNKDYIDPTVSEFLPYACNQGQGTGNYLGLCSYACHFGFCPIAVCKCTGTGALVPPGDGDGIESRSIFGDDHGLCNFACQRGYCPYPCFGTTTPTSTGIKASLPGSQYTVDPSVSQSV